MTYYIWLGHDSPIPGHKFVVLNDHSLVALEDTLVAHYSEKLKEEPEIESQGEDTFSQEKINVFLTEYMNNINEQKNSPRNLDNLSLLTLIASISSPVVDGLKLQASDLHIEEFTKEGFSRVYVGFNMRGPKMLGGIQIIKLIPPSKNEAAKVLLEQNILFKDSEIHGITYHDQKLYITGAISSEVFKTPAFLEVFELDHGLITDFSPTYLLDLPSYAGTSVLVAFDRVFVSSGDVEGGVTSFPLNFNFPDQYTSHNDLLKNGGTFDELFDPRDLSANHQSLFAVTGGQASLWKKRIIGDSSQPEPEVIPFEGANIPEAKSSIKAVNNTIYMGLGDGGTRIFSLGRNEVKGIIPQIEASSLDSSLTVTNAIEVDGNELYTADGEGGSRVFKIKNNGDLIQLTSLNFGPKMSVNDIKKNGDFVVFATGLGGIKVALKTSKSGDSNSKKDR